MFALFLTCWGPHLGFQVAKYKTEGCQYKTRNDSVSEYLDNVPPRTIKCENGAIVPLREVITTPPVSEMVLLHLAHLPLSLLAAESSLRSDTTTRTEGTRSNPRRSLGHWFDVWSLECLVAEFVQGIVLFSGNASENGTWTAEDDYLARVVEVRGLIPPNLLRRGLRSAYFFDEQGKLIRIPNLKPTSLDRMLNGEVMPFKRPYDMLETEIGVFIDFVRGVLKIDPTARKSAAQLVQHEWLS
ncbi:hypothetical protein PWT90_06750 [Aphanocladium album]|nr:hypothetical protein PWT90_06750 [Aphanocladium album]